MWKKATVGSVKIIDEVPVMFRRRLARFHLIDWSSQKSTRKSSKA